MKFLKTLGIATAIAVSTTTSSMAMTVPDIVYSVVNNNEIANSILYYCNQYQVDPLLATCVFEHESGFNQNALSEVGAIGIAQVMPSTASYYGLDPYDLHQNIECGVYCLSDNLCRYAGSELQTTYALAAYSAGPGAVAKYNGVPPYPETINYINDIADRYQQLISLED